MPSPPPTFAVPPLANMLLHREGLEIRRFDPLTGGYGERLTRAYSGIELDLWARRFLHDLDRVLEPRFGLAALTLAPKAVRSLVQSRSDLAATIADRLLPVLEGGDAGLAAARAALWARLKVRVSAAYAIAAVVLPGEGDPGRARLVRARSRRGKAGHGLPLPLRACPPLPVLVEMDALYPVAPADLQAAAQWTCRIVYRHPHAVEDRVSVEVRFNQGTAVSIRPEPAPDASDLFAGLAQYVEIAPELWTLLANAGQVTPAVLRKAIKTYAALARDVAAAWQAYRPRPPQSVLADERAAEGVETYIYRAGLAAEEGKADAFLILERLRADGAVDWPSVAVLGPGGAEVEPMAMREENAGRRAFAFAPDVLSLDRPASGMLQVALSFGALHIARHRNGWSQVRVERNAALLGTAGPPTQAPFVFQMPAVEFHAPPVPSIDVRVPVTIGPWSDDPAANPLRAVFDTLLIDGNAISISATCDRAVGHAPQSITITEPVFFSPPHEADAGEVAGIIKAIRAWRDTNSVSKGVFRFRLILFAPAAWEGQGPLLNLRELVSPFSA